MPDEPDQIDANLDEDEPDDASYRDLVLEPCLLAEDMIAVSQREPEAWRRFASTAEHSMGKADWGLPLLVIRSHLEAARAFDAVVAEFLQR